MKLPASSSLLLATLAISSSSSTLAAPATDCDTAITTSSSNHQLSALLDSSSIHDFGSADIDVEKRASMAVERSKVDSEACQKSLVSTFLGLLHTLPIIGHPVASLIESSLPNGTESVAGSSDISPSDLIALQAAIAEVSRALSQSNQTFPVSGPVQSVNSTASTSMSNGNGLNTDSSMSNGFTPTSAAALADPTNNASSPSAAAAVDGNTMHPGSASTPQSSPASPTIPGNPPNTPVPPVP